MYHKFYRNLASIDADNETVCTVLLTSQVIMIQGFQPKGREFDSTCSCFVFVLFYPYLIRLSTFIVDVPRPLSNVLWIFVFQKVDA